MRHLCIMMKHLIIFFSLITLSLTGYTSSLKELESKLDKMVDLEILASQASEIYMMKMKFKEYTMDSGVFVLKGYPVKKFSSKVIEKFKSEKTSKDAQKFFADTFTREGFGTGFLYKGYIITNFHVCRGGNVLAKDYQGNILAFGIVDFNPTQDVCVLKPHFKDGKYFDFGKDMETRQIAQTEEYNKKDQYIIHSIYGNIKSDHFAKDPVKDQWSKRNSFMTKNHTGECRGGISGSAVSGPKGFFGIAWGSSTEETKETECYFVERSSIDFIINAL